MAFNLEEAGKQSAAAQRRYLKNAEFLAVLKQDPQTVMKIVLAASELDPETVEDLKYLLNPEIFDQPHPYARESARRDFENGFYRGLCKATVRCIASGALRLAMKFTDEADQEFLQMRYESGDLERPAAVAPVVKKSAQEILEDEVVSDFATLSGDKMKAKMAANKNYRDTYNRLAETNRLETRCTALHDAGKIGG